MPFEADFLEPTGDVNFLASQEAELARALWKLGRHEEADVVSRSSQGRAAVEDWQAQAQWRQARSLVLASGGALEEAEELARQAVRIAEDTDWVWIQGLGLETLGIVLELRGNVVGAIGAFRGAMAVWEGKGNVVSAGRLKRTLQSLSPSA